MARARENDEDAFGKLFDFYIGRLRLYLRNKLTSQDRAEGFEDDLASETMTTIWQGLTKGRFENVTNRVELWYVMMAVGNRRALNRRKYLRCKKRLVGIPGQLATFLKRDVEPIPASHYFDVLDAWEQFMKTLPNDQYREIVRMSLEGMNVNEIATLLNIVPRTVERKQEIAHGHYEAFLKLQNYF